MLKIVNIPMVVVGFCLFLTLPMMSLAEEDTAVNVGEEAETEAFLLDEVVATATRSEKNVDSAPGNVTVISQQDLKSRDIHTIEDAMKYEAGFFNGKLRGMSKAHQTLVMLNGMPLNTGWRGHVRWENIAVENVKRVEVIRGPASALYGGNAMGGVINIITSTPEKLEAKGQIGYGSDGTVRYSASVGSRIIDKLSFSLGYEYEDTDGYPDSLVTRSISSGSGTLTGGYETLNNSGSRKWVVGDKGDEYSEKWNFNLNMLYDLTETGSLAFDFQLGHTEYGYGLPNTYLRDEDGDPAFSGKVDVGSGEKASVSLSNYITYGPGEIENPSYMITYNDHFGGVGFEGKVGYHHEDRWYTRPKLSGDETYDTADGYIKEFDSNVWFSDIQTNISIGENHYLTPGLYSRFDDFEGGRYELSYYQDENSKISSRSDVTLGKDRLYAAYLQDEWRIMDELVVYLGARLDYWETYDGVAIIDGADKIFEERNDSALSPKVSAVWNLSEETIIKGSIGKAFRPPSLYELYRTYKSGNGMVNSNPNLKPESLWNYEIGANQYFFNGLLKISATFFHSDIKDLIYYYKVGDDRFKDNAGEAWINGIEMEASAFPLEWLKTWANYTYNDSKIKKNVHNPGMEGKKITGMPETTISFGTEIIYRWITASLLGRYTGRIYVSEYNDDINDVYGAYSECWVWESNITVSPWENVDLAFSVDNLFDEEYFYSSVGRARNYFVEISLKW